MAQRRNSHILSHVALFPLFFLPSFNHPRLPHQSSSLMPLDATRFRRLSLMKVFFMGQKGVALHTGFAAAQWSPSQRPLNTKGKSESRTCPATHSLCLVGCTVLTVLNGTGISSNSSTCRTCLEVVYLLWWTVPGASSPYPHTLQSPLPPEQRCVCQTHRCQLCPITESWRQLHLETLALAVRPDLGCWSC